MSRTDKDRPYWVRSMDNLEARVPMHHCGWRYVWVRSEPTGEFYDKFVGYNRDGSLRYVVDPTRPKYRHFYEDRYFKCDIDAKVRTEEEYNDLKCGYLVKGKNWKSWQNCNPGWWVKQTATLPDRARKRATLTKAVRDYRTDPEEFLEDWDYGVPQSKVPWYW